MAFFAEMNWIEASIVSFTGIATILILTIVHLRLKNFRPLPGIPYNKEAPSRLLGDYVEIKKAKYRRRWIWNQPKEHNVPLFQLFLHPFRRPVVILTDYRESVDIFSRRFHEFDRGTVNKQCVGLMAPNFHFIMETRDPRFKIHREILRDLMTTDFLGEINGPRIYEKGTLLVNLWDMKSKMGQGRPFKAGQDLHLALLDIICSAAFGLDNDKTTLSREISHLESPGTRKPVIPESRDEPVSFDHPPADPEVEALLETSEMISIAQKSPIPVLSQFLALLIPRHAKAWWYRRALLNRQMTKSLEKLRQGGESARKCALDHLLWRELNAAKRRDRKPDLHSPIIRDETLGYLLAGHDTAATVTSWWVKYMSGYQSVQSHLREELRRGHSFASEEGRWPTMKEIHETSIPYLDAVIEETLRYASIATIVARRALCDTQILGYPIPKGTDLFICLTAASLTEPALPIPEEIRSSTSQRAKNRVPAWGDDVSEFRPERWLKTKVTPDGVQREVFDQNAGPGLYFGAGPRQCFGKKLAYMTLKMLVTLLLWNFEFEPMGEELNNSEILESLVNKPRDCYVKLKRL